MDQLLLNRETRLFFLLSTSIVWLGIGLTGFSHTHWILYLPATFSLLATITGICPVIVLFRRLLRSG